MKIVVNYLNEVRELFEEGKIDFVDYFKLYSLNEDLSGFDWCISHRPVMFHGAIGKAAMFGEKNLIKDTDIEKTKEVLQKAKTPYVSGHISVLDRQQTLDEYLINIKENISEYKKAFGKKIALENVPYREKYEKCIDLLKPEIISKIVYENDCMFLFDISHARSAADYFKMSFEDYVSKLPMDRVVEFHLAGMSTFPDGHRMDCHGKMNEEDYLFLQEAIKKYPTLEYITLEYGSYFPEEKLNLIEGLDIPLVSFNGVNYMAKQEIYEQLIKIRKILDR